MTPMYITHLPSDRRASRTRRRSPCTAEHEEAQDLKQQVNAQVGVEEVEAVVAEVTYLVEKMFRLLKLHRCSLPPHLLDVYLLLDRYRVIHSLHAH